MKSRWWLVAFLVAGAATAGCGSGSADSAQNASLGLETNGGKGTDPSRRVQEVINQLEAGGFACSVERYAARLGTDGKPEAWVSGPAKLDCLYGTDAQVRVTAYNNKAGTSAAKRYIADMGQVYIAGEDYIVAYDSDVLTASITRALKR